MVRPVQHPPPLYQPPTTDTGNHEEEASIHEEQFNGPPLPGGIDTPDVPSQYVDHDCFCTIL